MKIRTLLGLLMWAGLLTLLVSASAGAQSEPTLEERVTALEADNLALRQDVTQLQGNQIELQGFHGITTTTTAAPTTTTTTTTTTLAPDLPTEIGIVGCSMTKNANEGYLTLGGLKTWSNGGLSYGKGSVGRWADDITNPAPTPRYVETFQAKLADNPNTDGIIFGLCAGGGGSPSDLTSALVVLDWLETQAPGLPVYVIAQPDYTGPEPCNLAGPTGPADMLILRDEIAAGGHALLGPDQGPLDGSQVGGDFCHANAAGKGLLGAQLLDFFG